MSGFDVEGALYANEQRIARILRSVPPFDVMAGGLRFEYPAVVGEAVRHVTHADAEALERRVEEELAGWGECAWTARDCLLIVTAPDGTHTFASA